jgi:hypothetical protein
MAGMTFSRPIFAVLNTPQRIWSIVHPLEKARGLTR